MNYIDYDKLSDEEKIKILETKQYKDDLEKAFIIRTFSSDELKLAYISLVKNDENKACITYSMSNEENKMKIIDMMQDERYIAAAVIELKTDIFKVKYLEKIHNQEYISIILESLDVNNEEIDNIIKLINDERIKTLTIARIEDENKRKSYLELLTDINCQSRIVMTLDDEELKMQYIEKVDDFITKMLLITSLKDKEKKEKLLHLDSKKYTKISIPKGLTVGLEIECEGSNSSDAYVVDKIIPGWKGKRDNSLEEGVEVVSPILSNSEDDTRDIYAICNMLQSMGERTSSRCGGHIHFGANYLKTKEAFANLIELWMNNEEILFLLSNKSGEISREGVLKFSPPLSKKFEKEFSKMKFGNFEELTMEEFIKIAKGIKPNKIRRQGINFDNIGNVDKDTIEFRISNGTIDANTWIENINLFGGLIAISQEISDIQHKDISEITEYDKAILEKFNVLKSMDLKIEERLNILLDLCVPNEYKQIYIDRYIENSKLLDQMPEFKNNLEAMFSKRIIDFYARKIATKQTYSDVIKTMNDLSLDYLKFGETDLMPDIGINDDK